MIYLTGYFGASNTGDEAIALTISKHFSSLNPIITGGKFQEPSQSTIVAGGEYDSWMIEGSNSPLFATGVGLVRDLVGHRQNELKRFNQLWVRTHADYRLASSYNLNGNYIPVTTNRTSLKDKNTYFKEINTSSEFIFMA